MSERDERSKTASLFKNTYEPAVEVLAAGEVLGAGSVPGDVESSASTDADLGNRAGLDEGERTVGVSREGRVVSGGGLIAGERAINPGVMVVAFALDLRAVAVVTCVLGAATKISYDKYVISNRANSFVPTCTGSSSIKVGYSST